MGGLPANAGARALAVDPREPKRVYAASESGVHRSDDAGQTWDEAADGLPAGGVAALAVDPRQPARLYAATVAGALYLSTDGAGSWSPVAGAAAGVGR